MSEWVAIGGGYAPEDRRHGYPYEVAIDPAETERFMVLGEGQGYVACGGQFPLADLAKPEWAEQLRYCGSEWLADLAREELRTGRRYTAEEVLAMAEARQPPKPKRRWPFGRR